MAGNGLAASTARLGRAVKRARAQRARQVPGVRPRAHHAPARRAYLVTDDDVARTADRQCEIPAYSLVRVWRFRTRSLPNGTICACRVSAWRVAGNVGGSAE